MASNVEWQQARERGEKNCFSRMSFMWRVPCIVLRNITINAKSLYKKSKILFKNNFVTGLHHNKALQR